MATAHEALKRQKRGKPAADLFKANIRPGDFALIGVNIASTPHHWFMGEVLWADATHVLLHRSDWHGNFYRQVVSVEEVRAFGTLAECSETQRRASEIVRELERGVDAAERALGAARNAVWAKCEELALQGHKISPLDEEALGDREKIERAAVENLDAAEAAGD